MLKSMTVPKTKFSDLQLLSGLKGLAWLTSGQLKNLDDSMTSRNVKHKGVIFEERGVRSLDTHILLTGTANSAICTAPTREWSRSCRLACSSECL